MIWEGSAAALVIKYGRHRALLSISAQSDDDGRNCAGSFHGKALKSREPSTLHAAFHGTGEDAQPAGHQLWRRGIHHSNDESASSIDHVVDKNQQRQSQATEG
ncbi:unnamed protein product [Clonostachys rosea f. rosea IK726]|uniref:Uncharacterized protein n=1 Tax=Clonostachys rosea f. rosea IK726 TaxID=1349383 RepID=A0ACA9UBF8_BIOOC|nr:unnamed protein product [Clonostachys rosea f. rosea IK726]